MNDSQLEAMVGELADGRTELVFDLLAAGRLSNQTDRHGVSPIRHCAYYGDVSAIRFPLAHGESLDSLGENFDLNGASFHGHWRLCRFLPEQGADVNRPLGRYRRNALHAALCKTDRVVYDPVLRVLLSYGANPNSATKEGVATEGFMRDCRAKGETPLHRAAAFGDSETIQLLPDAGAKIDARDMNGDTPLAWASWYLRPTEILRQVCYGDTAIHPQYRELRANLPGTPRAGQKVGENKEQNADD